jgi:hypothetical protein
VRDNCQVCEGFRGGVRGNENIVEGITLCDYCSVTYDSLKKLIEAQYPAIKSFNITWKSSGHYSGYYVDIPNYDGGRVVPYDDVVRLLLTKPKHFEETQQSVFEWCRDTFPRHAGIKGRAIALIEEAVELGVAAGLSDEEIRAAVEVPLKKAKMRSEDESDRGEVGDVLICVLAYAGERGFDAYDEMVKKMIVNRSRTKEYYATKTSEKESLGMRGLVGTKEPVDMPRLLTENTALREALRKYAIRDGSAEMWLYCQLCQACSEFVPETSTVILTHKEGCLLAPPKKLDECENCGGRGCHICW